MQRDVYTVVVAGPAGQVGQVRAALQQAGFRIDPDTSDHRLGGQPGEGWLTVHRTVNLKVGAPHPVLEVGDQQQTLDTVKTRVAVSGWRIRMHHHTPAPSGRLAVPAPESDGLVDRVVRLEQLVGMRSRP